MIRKITQSIAIWTITRLSKVRPFSPLANNKYFAFSSSSKPSIQSAGFESTRSFLYKYSNSRQPSYSPEADALNEIKQSYKQYKWSEEYANNLNAIYQKYVEMHEFVAAMAVREFHLTKIQQHKGANTEDYCQNLFSISSDWEQLGQLSKAQQGFLKVFSILEQYPQLKKIIRNSTIVQSSLGNLYNKIERYEQSMEWLNKFMSNFNDFEQNKEVTPQVKFAVYYIQGQNYLHLSDPIHELERTEEKGTRHNFQKIAMTYYKKGLEMIQKNKIANVNKTHHYNVMFDYAGLCYKLEDQSKGLEMIKQANRMLNPEKDQQDYASYYNSYVNCYNLGIVDHTIEIIQRLLAIMEARGQNTFDNQLYRSCLQTYSSLCHKSKYLEKELAGAIKKMELVRKREQELGKNFQLVEIMIGNAAIYYQLNKFPEAREALREAKIHIPTINSLKEDFDVDKFQLFLNRMAETFGKQKDEDPSDFGYLEMLRSIKKQMEDQMHLFISKSQRKGRNIKNRKK